MIEIFKFDNEAKMPVRAHKLDAGLDLFANETVFLPTGTTKNVSTGIGIHIPPGYTAKIEDRSSLALSGLVIGAGIIDSGYNGEVKIVLHNFSNTENSQKIHQFNQSATTGKLIKKGDKIAQIVVYKIDTTDVMQTNILWDSERKDKGFGSSGK
jgi:dUTP pyrophosphatase